MEVKQVAAYIKEERYLANALTTGEFVVQSTGGMASAGLRRSQDGDSLNLSRFSFLLDF